MVRQRVPTHSRISSSHLNSYVSADNSICRENNSQSSHQKQQQQQRRQIIVDKCRVLCNGIARTIAFIFVVLCLSIVWSDDDASLLRKLRRVTKKSTMEIIDTLSLNHNVTYEAKTISEKNALAVDDAKHIDSDIEYLVTREIITAAVEGKDNSSSITISDLSITVSNNMESSSQSTINPCYRMKNEADIRKCYVAHNVRKFSDQRCQSIQNWKDVQHCLMRRYFYPNNTTTNNSRIREVHIVGERNSGTKFITQFLQQCFPKKSKIRVHRDFIRSKHFFQPIHNKADYTNSLIVVVVRDPIEWMAAMREFPYHSPSHLAGFKNGQIVPLPWQEFVNKTWTTMPSPADRRLTTGNRTKVVCSQSFRFDEVKPCILRQDMITGPPWNIPLSRVRGYYPLYEQRRGKPYDHLLQMRSDKIVNWILQIPLLMRIGGFLVVRYEDILERGNGFFLEQVNALLTNNPIDSKQSLPKQCSVIAPQPDRIGKRYIPPDFKDWINKNIDVESERLIGYR
jgi:hypothetical protein